MLFKHIFKYLNPSNLLMLGLIFLTLLNCWLSFENLKTQDLKDDFDGIIRILEEKKPPTNSKYPTKYLASSNLGNIFLDNKNKYEIGHQYKISGNLSRYQLDYGDSKNPWVKKISFDSYYISSGIIGEINNVKIIENIGCDTICDIVNLNQKNQNSLLGYYDQQICKNLYWLSTWFGNTCTQSLAWSNGLVLGQGNLFDSDTKEKIKKLGLTHLIVVSGSQVGLIFAFGEWFLSWFGLNKKWQFWGCMVGVLLLIGIVGVQAPVLRSSISIILATLSLVFLGRKLNPVRGLLYSGIILLWCNPFYIISYSFWLSFVASFGLIIITKVSKVAEVEIFRDFKQLALSCVGTFLYTLPIAVNLSGFISPVAILSNLIFLPIIEVITMLNILGFIPIIGEVFLFLATVSQNLIIVTIPDLSNLTTMVRVQPFALWQLCLYWLALTVLLVSLKHYLVRLKNKSKAF